MSNEVRRIGVNLMWIVPGEVGGSEEYTVRLLRSLADANFADIDVTLYVNRRFKSAYPDLVKQFRTRVAPVSGTSRPLRVVAESTWLAVRARLDRCDVVHHAGGTMPTVRFTPGIVTLHDLQPIVHPERFSFVKRTYISLIAPRSMRAARSVVCLSQFTANDAVGVARVDPAKIRLIPCGVDDPGAAFDAEAMAALHERLGLVDRPFILYPAITYPHKNHETLVAAFAAIDSQDCKLVLTGGTGSAEALVEVAIDSYGVRDRVVRPGRIPESELDLLYRSATALAFPSLYEGFGLPALEALSRGCPVVSSDVGGLPFVLGDAAEYVSALDVHGWASALDGLISDPARRSVLIRRGFEQARLFSWPHSAASLASVYREIW